MNAPPLQPSLLGKLNERRVLRAIQTQGPSTRAEVTRYLGITAPTVSKAVASLLRSGLLEEIEAAEPSRGRPAARLRLASEKAQVLGLVIDAEQCRVVAAGLDGKLRDERESRFATPETYEQLIDSAAEAASGLIGHNGTATLGLGISIPGLIDYRQQQGVLSPNVPITDGRSPSRDLHARLGLDCVMLQESHALCLAERYYGAAQGLDDFAMVDVGAGVGLGVMSGGRLLTGHSGLAGEIGHLPVEPDGRPCGCGGRGCLETLASDSALAWEVSQRLGRKLTVEQVLELVREGELQPARELAKVCRHLAFALATVINLFNPSTLFVHGRLFEADENLFGELVEQTRARSLRPSFADCRIVQARGSKRQGAVAGAIEQLTAALAPALDGEPHYMTVENGSHDKP